ncbi:hypothetical protein, partial [Micromonospora sp. AB353]|uniref:hypothetical protein n=1 Tax=Micromonospora sp. AB353 TaxID=3413282 RepID=UPI003C1D4803
MAETIASPEYCTAGPDERIRCFNEETLLFVVYSPNRDTRAPDGRTFGIITAYYQLPCFAACNEPPTDTNLVYTGSTATTDGNIPVSARLKDNLGILLPNKSVTFTTTVGSTTFSCSDTTNSSGVAACNINATKRPAGSSLTVQARFPGNSSLNASSASATVAARAPISDFDGDWH